MPSVDHDYQVEWCEKRRNVKHTISPENRHTPTFIFILFCADESAWAFQEVLVEFPKTISQNWLMAKIAACTYKVWMQVNIKR